MSINIGSTNPTKIKSVEEVTACYKEFRNQTFHGVEVDSKVSSQPLSLEELFRGSRNRALQAYDGRCDYSIGLESGFFQEGDRFFNCTVCSIYDGKNYFEGISPAFLVPSKIVDLVQKGNDLNEAVNILGWTQDPENNKGKGFLGILTDDQLTRMEYMKPAVHTALIPLRKHLLF